MNGITPIDIAHACGHTEVSVFLSLYEVELSAVHGLSHKDILAREALLCSRDRDRGGGWEMFPDDDDDSDASFMTASEVGARLISDLRQAGERGIQLGEPSAVGNPTFRDPETGDSLLHVAVNAQQYVSLSVFLSLSLSLFLFLSFSLSLSPPPNTNKHTHTHTHTHLTHTHTHTHTHTCI